MPLYSPHYALSERYGLTVTIPSSLAAERFQEGMDRLLSYGPDTEESVAAALQTRAPTSEMQRSSV